MASNKTDHISVCIVSFKRPQLLRRLLRSLQHLNTGNAFSYSVVVVDNDKDRSAEMVVRERQDDCSVRIDYHVEPRQNLSLARNRAVQESIGSLVAFIDDDEVPVPDWLLALFNTLCEHKVDGVLGPVNPHFEHHPPHWILKSKVFEHGSHETGHILDWNQTRSGNVLLRRTLFESQDNRFDPSFGFHGEDKDFFKRMIQKGCTFVWCDKAVVYETQGPERFTKSYHVLRALLRGSIAYRHAPSKFLPVAKSLIACLLYTAAIPFLFFVSEPWFATYLIKDCDHLGRLLGAIGYDVEGQLKKKRVSISGGADRIREQGDCSI